MSRHPGLYQWISTVTMHFPSLSRPQATVLALWSFGMILARSCALSAVAGHLAALLGQPTNTVRQRLKDWYRPAIAKRGYPRAELDVIHCRADWWHWVLQDWSARRLALALDATSLGQRFVVLTLSVVYRGNAVPVAWKVLPAALPHAWQPEWLTLLRSLHGLVPADWQVVVLTDRGLYARWLFEGIQELGWHPLMRVNIQGTFRPEGWKRRVPMTTLVPHVGSRWQGRGQAFANPAQRLNCTLLGCWEAPYADPWLVVTDLPPQAAQACWYGMRAWIEQGFKRLKSGGWQWQHTRMTDPGRAERLWLALAVTTWWLLVVGGEAEASIPPETLPPITGSARRQGPRWRLEGIFQVGYAVILAALLMHEPLPWGKIRPEPWPQAPPATGPPSCMKQLNEFPVPL
jgi:Transposase DDE domain